MCFLLHLNRFIDEAKKGIKKNLNFSLQILTEDIPTCDSVCEYKPKTDISSLWVADRQSGCSVREWMGEVVRIYAYGKAV